MEVWLHLMGLEPEPGKTGVIVNRDRRERKKGGWIDNKDLNS
jgi:hypothetical protein